MAYLSQIEKKMYTQNQKSHANNIPINTHLCIGRTMAWAKFARNNMTYYINTTIGYIIFPFCNPQIPFSKFLKWTLSIVESLKLKMHKFIDYSSFVTILVWTDI